MMGKALRALASARLLLDAGDVDGACNRAYYAMFDAARAALAWANISVEEVRTHNGLISAFSLHLVKTGRLPVALGRALNRVEEIRLVADYMCGEVPVEMAQDAVEHAASFIAAIQRAFSPSGTDGKSSHGLEHPQGRA
jgi:uncharacterized protein (UPF0332 family)